MADVLVSAEVRPVVSAELLTFVEKVLILEELTHWPVHIWACKREGLCDSHICFGPCETEMQTKALFLHEVAHAILNPKRTCNAKDWHPDSYWHKAVWQQEFERLCKAYHIVLQPEDRVKHYLQEVC